MGFYYMRFVANATLAYYNFTAIAHPILHKLLCVVILTSLRDGSA